MRSVLLVAALSCLAAAPPAKRTPEQEKLLRLREGWEKAGFKAWREGRPDEAFDLLGKILDVELRVLGPWHRDAEDTAKAIAWRRKALGQWDKEAECRRMILEMRRRLDGEGHWKTVDARLGLAEALAQQKRTPAQRDALARARRLNAEGVALHLKGRLPDALPLLREALKANEAVLGTTHPDYATSLNNLAGLLHDMGSREAALPLFQKALKINEGALGKRHPNYANSLNSLALLLRDMGDARAALPLFREAFKVNEAALGRRHSNYATGLNNLALTLAGMGDRRAALPLYREAVRVNEAALGKRHPNYATSLNNLAGLLQLMGDRRAALPLMEEALKVREAALGKRHHEYALSLSSLGGLLREMGDHKAALPLFREARKVMEAALGKRHPHYALCLNNLAQLLKDMGDHEAALPLLREALKVNELALGRRHPRYADALNNLAELFRDMRDFKAARPLYDEALKVNEAAVGKRHANYANTLGNLAVLFQDMGDARTALPRIREAVKLNEAALGRRHPGYANSLGNLAMILLAGGDPEAALPPMEEALAIFAAVLRDDAAVLSDRQQLAAAAALRHHLDNRLGLLDLKGHPAAAEHVLAWKGSILVRQQRRRLFLRLASDDKTRAAARRLQAITRELAEVRASTETSRERLAALEKEQDEAQAKLSDLSAAFRESLEERITPTVLAKSLPEEAVLVDYLFYGPPGKRSLAAFVHRRGRACARIDLGPAAPVEMAAAAWRALLLSGKPDAEAGAALKKLALAPLARHIEGAKVLLVSPDGVLGTVPFAALPGKEKGTYLIEDMAVAVVPVPRQIPELMRPVPEKGRLAPSLLAVGGVDYEPGESAALAAARGAPMGVSREWSSLPGTAAEARAVARSFAAAFKKEAVRLSGADATAGKVRGVLAKARYAHLATHGYFAPEVLKSALADAGGRASGERREAPGWHPLLLSGLAFAGANRTPRPGEEDGILTALEVSEMDLTGLEVAVLSACETGLGKVAGGEGLLGMQRAFAAAGARTVAASLWKVDDEATRVLMADFYTLAWDAKKAVSLAEALRQAQLAMMHRRTLDGRPRGVGKIPEKIEKGKADRVPPYYWAAFVLSGDWR
jgi:CHAT domain-containing protein/tetratricopeptide (TPR) repeat protein